MNATNIPAVGTAVRVRTPRGGYLATVTARATLVVVHDGRALERRVVFLDTCEGRFSAPLHVDAGGAHCLQAELVPLCACGAHPGGRR